MTADYLTTGDYAARRELKNYSEGDMLTLAKWITAASRWVDNYCMVRPGEFDVSADNASNRYYSGTGWQEQWIPAHASIVSVAVSPDDGNTWYTLTASTDYWVSDGAEFDASPTRLLVINPSGGYSHFYRGMRTVRVNGVRGLATTPPEPIKEAVAHITHEMVMRRRGQAEGDRMVVTGSGFVIPAQAMPPIIRTLLNPYIERRT